MMTNFKTIQENVKRKAKGDILSTFQMSIHLLKNNNLLKALNLEDVKLAEFKMLEHNNISFDVSLEGFYLFGLFICDPKTNEIVYCTLEEVTKLYLFDENYSLFLYTYIKYSLTKNKLENF